MLEKEDHLVDNSPRSNVSPCPVRQIIRANEFGIVIESNRDFEVGESISLGFHLSSAKSKRSSQFICAEALVVDSQKLLLAQDGRSFRVTLLFSDISHEDRAKLIKVSRAASNPERQSSMGLN